MRVYLATAYKQGIALRHLKNAARLDRFHVHEIAESPDQADVILFVENGELDDPFYAKLLRHPFVTEERERTFMYNEWDYPWCVLPGLYVGMPRRSFDAQRQASFCYLFTPNEFIADFARSRTVPDLLFSFAGARNHRLRKRVLALSDPRAHVEDTHAFSIWRSHEPEEVLKLKRIYAEVLGRSKFVLCPRGAGTSSFRLFETLEAGRVPVIISDQWVPSEGPDWSFAVRVPESAIASIPDTLRNLESEAHDRGRAARAAWEEWFAPDVTFHRAVELLVALRQRGATRRRVRDQLPDLEHLRMRTKLALRDNAGRDLLLRLLRGKQSAK